MIQTRPQNDGIERQRGLNRKRPPTRTDTDDPPQLPAEGSEPRA